MDAAEVDAMDVQEAEARGSGVTKDLTAFTSNRFVCIDAKLTGSRYFGTNKNYSDYDYYAKDSIVNRYLLELQGFKKYNGGIGTDLSLVYKRGNIDIQLRHNPEARDKIHINNSGLAILLMNKQISRHIWKILYRRYK